MRSRRRRSPFAPAALAALVFASAVATARTAVADPAASADDALQRGVELRKEGKDEGALQEFERAYAIAPTPRARAQTALAEQALGRWVVAEQHLKEALASRDDPWIARYAEPLEKALATVARHLGTIDVEANVAGATLSVNGARAAGLPLAAPIRVVAGTAVIGVQAKGFVEVRRTIEVAPSATMHEAFTLVAEPPPGGAGPGARGTAANGVSPTSDRASARGNGLRIAGVAIGGAGIAGLAIGGYFGARTFSDKSDRDGHCNGNTCDTTGVDLDHDARAHATIATIAVGAGLACVATGAILYWRGAVSSQHAQSGFYVTPAFAKDAAGLAAMGAW